MLREPLLAMGSHQVGEWGRGGVCLSFCTSSTPLRKKLEGILKNKSSKLELVFLKKPLDHVTFQEKRNKMGKKHTIKNNTLIKWPLGDVFFSSYLVIFPAALSPFLSEWVTNELMSSACGVDYTKTQCDAPACADSRRVIEPLTMGVSIPTELSRRSNLSWKCAVYELASSASQKIWSF